MKNYRSSALIITSLVLGFTTTAQSDIIQTNPVPTPTPISVPTPTDTSALNNLEKSIYDRINNYRQSLDLPPLAIDLVISAQARIHSEEMAKIGNMNHDGFTGRTDSIAKAIPFRSAAENVAVNMSYKRPDLIAVEGWIESPGHHRNIIGRFDLTGIGVVQGARGEYYFTQIFVRRRVAELSQK
jgi:uncharacterized protein YkwD